MSSDEKDEEMICALTADEYAVLKKGLDELPETMPPRDVWLRIRQQAEAEGLLQRPGRSRAWYAGVGIAAAALLAAVILPNIETTTRVDPGITVPPVTANNGDVAPSGLIALRAESRQIERDLRALPAQPRVAQAGTVATIAELEDRIAAIDYQLNDSSVDMSLEETETYWRERVRLMKLLLQLRYAQAQRAAY